MSVALIVRRIAAALTVAGVGFTGLSSVGAEPAPIPSGGEAPLQAGAPICPVKARTVFEFTDPRAEGDQLVSSQAFLKGQDPTPVDPGVPIHDGAQFLGWYYLDENGNVTERRFDPAAPEVAPGAVTRGPDSVVRVAAKYRDAHLVRFFNADALAGALLVPDGEPVNLSREGEVVRQAPPVKNLPASTSTAAFAGWATRPGGKPDYDLSAPVHTPQDLHASYRTGYVVTFDTKGGSYVPVRTVAEGKKLDAGSVTPPRREGYRFKHWALAGTTAPYDFNTPVSRSFTLDAIWETAEVPYAVVFMRETVEGGTYEIDSVTNAAGLTGSVAYPERQIAEKEQAGGITEENLVEGAGQGGENTIRFVYNEEKTRAEKVTVSASGETVKRVYYDRPRYTLTYAGKPTDPQGKQGPDFVKTYPNIIAGAPTQKYAEQFVKEFDQAIEADAATNPQNKWVTGRYYRATPEGRRFSYWLGFKKPNSRPIGYSSPPKMPGRDFSLQVVNPERNAVVQNLHFIEVDPNQPGELKTVRSPYDPAEKIRGGRVLTDSLMYAQFFAGKRVMLTAEDFVPIVGFSTIERRIRPFEHTKDASGDQHWVIRYTRNSYPVELRDNGGPRGDRSVDVPYQAPVKDALASEYQMGKTTRPSDGAVFMGWYDNELFSGRPYSESDLKMPAHGLVLYAKWVQPQVEVRYHEWDRQHPLTAPVATSASYARDSRLAELAEPTVPDGYQAEDFLGWYYVAPGGYPLPFNTGKTLLRDYDVYPRWPSREVHVLYHTGEGSGRAPDTSGQLTYVGATLVAENAPELVPPAGKVFLGWQVRGGDGARLLPGRSYQVSPVDQTDTAHLDPVFGPRPPRATLTYLPNGGQGQPVTQSHPDYARVEAAPADTFNFPGHRFVGWATSPEGPAIECGPGVDLVVPPGAAKLYALWEQSVGSIGVVKVGPAGEALDGAGFSVYPDIDRTGVGIAAVKNPTEVGTFTVAGLQIGREYFLAETRAPKGHELMPVPVGFTLGEDGTVRLTKPAANPNVTVAGTKITVADVKAGHLPATGGPGHIPYYIVALVLFAAAAATTTRKSRTAATRR